MIIMSKMPPPATFLLLVLWASAGLARAEEGQAGGARVENPISSDAIIAKGYQRYQGVCSHCHGPDGVGSTFAPALIDRPINHDAFRDIVLHGRADGTFAMPGYAGDPNVTPYIDAIFSYLKARRGGLARGRPPAK